MFIVLGMAGHIHGFFSNCSAWVSRGIDYVEAERQLASGCVAFNLALDGRRDPSLDLPRASVRF